MAASRYILSILSQPSTAGSRAHSAHWEVPVSKKQKLDSQPFVGHTSNDGTNLKEGYVKKSSSSNSLNTEILQVGLALQSIIFWMFKTYINLKTFDKR